MEKSDQIVSCQPKNFCFAADLPTEQQPEGDSLLLLLPCDPTTAATAASSPEHQAAVVFGAETGCGVKSWAAAE